MSVRQRQVMGVTAAILAAVVLLWQMDQRVFAGQAGRGGARPTYSLSDPVPNDPVLKGAIDLHAHQDPDSNGPSYGQAARSDDGIDLYKRAKASGMRGFVVKEHLDQSATSAYYLRKLYPDFEIFGGIGSNLTTGPKVNPWAVLHMTEMKGGWGRIVWMPSWDSENSSHRVRNYMSNLATALAPRQMRANTVSPGTIYFDDGVWGQRKRDMPEIYAAALAQNPMGRMGTPAEVANAVAFVASPAASFITGANLVVDGGFTRRVQY